MAIKSYKPTTAARRQMTVTDYSSLSKVAPEKSLVESLKTNSGRNSYGRITVRHRGGGNRRKYRIIDFKRDKAGIPAQVLTLEYDPNRSAHIALVHVIGEILTPVFQKPLDGGILYDFGVNHSGGIACEIKGERGRKVTIKFAEVLYDDGTPNYETGRWLDYNEKGEPHCIDQSGEYILSGGVDTVQPTFSWQCYRYAYVENAAGLEISDMRSYFIYMDVVNENTFSCDNPLFCEIYEKARRTILCNLRAGLLTDCPHREKRPYTGDGGVMAESLLYDFDSVAFLDKWLDDIIFAQTQDGFIPYTAPYLGGGGGYAWSNVIATLPTQLYRVTGEKKYLEKSYGALVKWLGYYERHSTCYIVEEAAGQAWCLGDWLAPEITEFHIPYMSTLCYRQAASAALFAARELQNGDEQKWLALQENIQSAIHAKFFDKDKTRYCKGIQGENVLPLAYGIVPKAYEDALKEETRRKYAKKSRFDTGIVATPILLDYLTENGMEDIAYKMMSATDYPSYAYMLQGETTLSEHWSKKWPDYHIGNSEEVVKGGGHLSHCHPMFASVVAWLYKRVAGLDLSNVYQGNIRFAPKLIKQVKAASARTKTPFGEASIAWQAKDGFSAEIMIPQGLQGQFYLTTEQTVSVEKENGERTVYSASDVQAGVLLPC
ncbi:MAG: family 78 glycoside hydrolase catalytic domain, partial [Clostridia bacterium]|nr:family 78 glycoside hydrolase catalytic domain [Clostridia bacterium]